MATYADWKSDNTSLIRKALRGSAFIAPTSTADLVSLTSGASSALVTLPTGYKGLGIVSKDGFGFPRETELSEVTSFGYNTPTRTDQISDVMSMTVTCQETTLLTLGLYIGVDTTGIEAAAVTGELRIAKPSTALNLHYRLLQLAVDENEAGEIYMARYFPYAKVVERGEQTISDGDDPVQYSLTFRAEPDPETGKDVEWLYSGPGWQDILTDMAITQAS
jgi:hypothetical protein